MLTTVRDAKNRSLLWVPSSNRLIYKTTTYVYETCPPNKNADFDFDFEYTAIVITMDQVFVEAGKLTEEQKLAFSILKGDPVALDMAKDILKL